MKTKSYSLYYTEPIIIKRKKLGLILTLFFGLPVFLFLIFIGFNAMFKGAPLIIKFFLLFHLVFPVWLLRNITNPIKKIFSSNPEYKITEDSLILYDHPIYESIRFEDMIACELHSHEWGSFLMLQMKLESPYMSNTNAIQRWTLGIPKDIFKYICLPLDFADVGPQYFCHVINERIRVTR